MKIVHAEMLLVVMFLVLFSTVARADTPAPSPSQMEFLYGLSGMLSGFLLWMAIIGRR